MTSWLFCQENQDWQVYRDMKKLCVIIADKLLTTTRNIFAVSRCCCRPSLLIPQAMLVATFGRSRSWLFIFHHRSFIYFGLFFLPASGSKMEQVHMLLSDFLYGKLTTRSLSFLFLAINITNIIIHVYRIWVRKAAFFWRTDHKSRRRGMQQFEDSKQSEFEILSGPGHFPWLTL